MRHKSLFLFFILGVLVSETLAFGEEINNRIVAFVNDDVITLYEIHKEYRERTGAKIDELMIDPQAYKVTCERLIEMLVNELLTTQKEKEMKIEVAKAEIDKAVEDIEINNGITKEQLINEIKRQGLTYEKFRENIESDLKKRKIINYQVQQKIVVSDEEVANFYEKNKGDYMQEERMRLSTIFLQRNNIDDEAEDKSLLMTARNIINGVHKGESFADMAKKYSKGPGAADGGDIGYFSINQLDPALYEIIKDFKPNEITAPIVKDEGIHIVMVSAREGMSAKSIGEVKGEIIRTLQREKIDQRYEAWLTELRGESYIKIAF